MEWRTSSDSAAGGGQRVEAASGDTANQLRNFTGSMVNCFLHQGYAGFTYATGFPDAGSCWRRTA